MKSQKSTVNTDRSLPLLFWTDLEDVGTVLCLQARFCLKNIQRHRTVPCLINEGGTKEEAVQAINYYISSSGGEELDLVIKEDEIYSESIMKQFLDDGHVLYIARGNYKISNEIPSREGGHATVITGYCYKNGKCWFVMQDPGPEDSGGIYFISYEKIVNGANPYFEEELEKYPKIWDGTIVVNTSYSEITTFYYWDQ